MAFMEALWGEFRRPPIEGFVIDVILFLISVCSAFLVGLMVGWAWRPSWANLDWGKLESLVLKKIVSAPSSPGKTFGSSSPSPFVEDNTRGNADCAFSSEQKAMEASCSSSKLEGEEQPAVAVSGIDFKHLFRLVEETDGGPSWIQMMDRSTPTMSYRAWRRDPKTGPPQYRSRTIYENATPDMVRDFFWDDEFRVKWDDMLIQAKTIENCPSTGTMIVHWIRKFPFFCSDREYIIGRRIWESERTYYCVTKGVSCPSVPRRDKPRRVDLYYSSWCIRAVESRRGSGEMTACEVLLFHHEDMGIPWEIAKLGVRQGMWGAVKKIEPGLRAYQKARAGSKEPTLSYSASMAHINTIVSPQQLRSLLTDDDDDDDRDLSESHVTLTPVPEKRPGINIPKLLVFGGAIALACSLDRGLLTKAVIFGVARRFGRGAQGKF
ncbi:hypothetical protein Dimus_000074 [Dionaea muscipula]